MIDSDSDDMRQLRARAEQNRAAKLRAMGRELQIRAEYDLRKAQLTAELQNSKQQTTELEAQLEAARSEFQALVNSRSWKITQPLRTVTAWVHGHGSEGAPSPKPPSPAPPQSTPDASIQPAASKSDEIDEKPDAPADEDFLTHGRSAWDEEGERRLQAFLSSDRRLVFPSPSQPAISIVTVLYNKAHLAFLCLESILRNAETSYELILIDNASTDSTARLLERLDAVKVIRNQQNLGFGYACNQGAGVATGDYLCFLNNDAVMCPGTLDAAIADFKEMEAVGAVGGKMLLSDGRLQEAGSIVWSDGVAWGYGREADAALPRYAFRRPVDYCSGALLFTPRTVFQEVGGFDERFGPAYYEDTDYCFKLWDRGLKVIYEPRAVIHHYESASQESSEVAMALIASHRTKFVEKWRERLATHLHIRGDRVPYARFAASSGGTRVLYLSQRFPHRGSDTGNSRANDFVSRLNRAGHHLTCSSLAQAIGPDEYTDIPREIELVDATAEAHYVFRELLSQYDIVWIDGEASMREFLSRMWDMGERVPPIVYQASPMSEQPEPSAASQTAGNAAADSASDFAEALVLCHAADIVLVESERDRQLLADNHMNDVRVLSAQTVTAVIAEVAASPISHVATE